MLNAKTKNKISELQKQIKIWENDIEVGSEELLMPFKIEGCDDLFVFKSDPDFQEYYVEILEYNETIEEYEGAQVTLGFIIEEGLRAELEFYLRYGAIAHD